MTAKSLAASGDGTSPPAMMLPGQFNVSASGAATYTVPISVPPGTAGMVPALSLDYSSQNGDGTLGLGWTLSGLPSIGRCPRTTAQDSVHGGVNYDLNDRFCMEGQRLIVITGTYGADNSEYRTEIEGFSKIIAHGAAGNGPAWFEVRTKSGQIMQFGNTADSQLLAVGKTTARAWAVNKITDTKGNYLTVTYTDDTVNGQAYPTRIDYTGNTGLTPYNSVQFAYNTARPDVTPTYQAGSLQQTTVLLTNVKAYAGATLVSDYRLTYELGTTLRRSRITSIKLCDGAGVCLAPTSFGWQGSRDTLTFTAVPNGLGQSADILTGKPNKHGFFPNYINTDALTDAVVGLGTGAACASSVYAGSQAGTFSLLNKPLDLTHPDSRYSDLGPSCFYTNPTSNNNVFSQFADFNGDGLTDAVMSSYNNPGANHHFMYNGATNFVESYFINTQEAKPLLLGDFTGDGRSDFFEQNVGKIYVNNGNGVFNIGTIYSGLTSGKVLAGDFDGNGCTDLFSQDNGTNAIIYQCSPALAQLTINNWLGNSWQIVFGDFNGDGKLDILGVKDGSPGFVDLSTGTALLQTSFSVPGLWNDKRLYAGDFNGDGKSDIVAVGPSGGDELVYLSTGTGFVQVATLTGGGDNDRAAVGDWNNDGADDIWLQKSNGDTEYLFSYVPERLTTVSNGLGVTTTFTYDRLNHATIYTKDTAGTYPTINLDGPMYVVSRVDSSDGIGGIYSSSYSYTGAKADLTGRGFLGFKQRVVTDLETGIVQTTNYNQTYPYLGLIDSETKKSGTVTLSSVTNTFGNTAPGAGRRFVFLQQKVETPRDLNNAVMPTVTTAYTYDTYGNPLTVTVTTTSVNKVTTNTYNNDTTNWFLGRLLTASTNSTVNGDSLTRSSSFAYDAVSGLITQETVEPNFSTLKLVTKYTYDAFGNKKITTVDPGTAPTSDDRLTTTTYDTKGEFLTNVKNTLNQDEDWVSHASFGTPTSHTGPNNLTTAWGYDTFARKTLETRPDGNKTGVAYFYCNGVNGGTTSCPTYGAYAVKVTPLASNGTTQNGPISWTYFDALGRVIANDVQGFDGSWIRVATQYDAFGRVKQTSRPYFITGGTPKWTVNTYDTLGRVTQATFPDGSDTIYTFNGLITTVKNDLNQTTTTTKDALGQVVSVKDPNNKTTTYTYDPFGNLETTTDSAGNVITNTYDLRGRKIASSDPDMGNWTYGYNAFGELTGQTDTKNQTTSLTYDALGRLTHRGPNQFQGDDWTYDSALHGIGKLRIADGGPGYTRTHFYDTLGRPSSVQIGIQGTQNQTISETYDANGRLDTVTYPSGFKVRYTYNAYGYLSTLKNDATGQVFWTASTRDAELHTLTQVAGNGITTTQAFNANTGMLQTAQAGAANAAANFTYNFDTIGNLKQRQDLNTALTENFCYDALNRLTNSAISASSCTVGTTVKIVGYDNLGNITTKSDVGTYVYPLAGQPYPHAVQSIAGTVNGVVNPVFTYDANGNMTDGAGRTFTYTTFNMAASITQGATVLTYAYDTEHSRISQASSDGTVTYYYRDEASGITAERFGPTGSGQWNEYLFADGRMVGVHFAFDDTTEILRYFIADHLGSIAVLLDETGAVAERDSYDAWGKRRNPDGTDDTSGAIVSQTTRGFTGQEHIAAVGLINFNARLYDPQLGRFLSPDSVVENPYLQQLLNRYSYVGNNPLSFTDPSGNCFLGCIWQNGTFRAVLAIIIGAAGQFWALPALEFELGIEATLATEVINAGIAGGVSGYIQTGKAQGALIGALQNAVSRGIGLSNIGPVGKAGAIAVVGGLASEAGGGKFTSGFLAAGFSSGASPYTSQLGLVGGTIASAVIGGTASVLGGGKFANGAVTGAFAYIASALAKEAAVEVRSTGDIPPTERMDRFTEALAFEQRYDSSMPDDSNIIFDNNFRAGMIDAEGHVVDLSPTFLTRQGLYDWLDKQTGSWSELGGTTPLGTHASTVFAGGVSDHSVVFSNAVRNRTGVEAAIDTIAHEVWHEFGVASEAGANAHASDMVRFHQQLQGH